MIQFVKGEKGSGKTKKLIDLANSKAHELKGHIVYIDHTCKNRFNLSHHIRLIEANTFPITSSQDLFGFLCGILSSNHDVELIIIDELPQLSKLSIDILTQLLTNLKKLSEKYNVNFVIGTSCDTSELPSNLIASFVA